MDRLRLLACTVFLLSLVACSQPKLQEKSPEELQSGRAELIRRSNADYDAQIGIILSRMEQEVAAATRAEDAVFDILAIHGGGASGGFAPGFLQGWEKVTDPDFRRPEFDLVTGASSGALIAPLAFIGTPEAYGLAFEMALDPPFSFARPTLFSLEPTRSAILDNDELAASIARTFDSRVVEGLAAGARDHRVALIATTDLEAGLARVWDIARMSVNLEPQAAQTRLNEVLLASTAIPILLPPVEIDGRLHADGGVAATVFVGLDALAVAAIAEQWGQRNAGVPMPRIRTWVIINQKLEIAPQNVRPRYLDLAQRSVNIMMEYDRQKALLAFGLLAAEMNQIEGVRSEFRYVSIPLDARTPAELVDLEDKELIASVVNLGFEMGKSPASWSEGTPQVYRLVEPELRE